MRDFMSGIGGLVLVVALTVGGVYGFIYLYRDAAPKYQEVQQEVFQNTPSYVNGKIDELSRMRRQFETESDPAVRKAIREEVLTSAGTVDNEKLPPDLRSWIQALKNNPIILKK